MLVQLVKSGVYEFPKEDETYIPCWVLSQSKSVVKYFPYKESTFLLFEAI